MTSNSQCKRVLEVMRNRKKVSVYLGITSLEAFRMNPPITRLSAVIFELRKQGHVIEDKWHYNHKTRSRYVEYVLRKEAVMMICSHVDKCRYRGECGRKRGHAEQEGCKSKHHCIHVDADVRCVKVEGKRK